MGKPTEVFDTKMAGLHADATKTRCFIENMPQNRRPSKTVFYADNTGAIHRIFEGSLGKAQAHSRGFRKEICNILNEMKRQKFQLACALNTKASQTTRQMIN